MANSPSKSKRAVTFRLDRDLVSQAQRVAAEREETVTDLVVRAVAREVSEHDAGRSALSRIATPSE